jgi:hypothetical protein
MADTFTTDLDTGAIYNPATGIDNAIISGIGCKLEATAAAAILGTKGLAVTFVYNFLAYIAHYPHTNLKHTRQAFYFDPNGIVIAAGQYCRLAQDMLSASSPYTILLSKTDGIYSMFWRIRKDDDSNVNSAPFIIIDAQHLIEFEWKASGGGVLGYMKLWYDGRFMGVLSNIDNDTHFVSFPALGWTYETVIGSSGVMFLDAWRGNDTGALVATEFVVPPLCDIRHESNDFSEWTMTLDTLGHMTTSAAAALKGSSYGMQCYLGGTATVMYGSRTLSYISDGVVHARFYIKPNGLTFPTEEDLLVLNLRNAGASIAYVYLGRNGANYIIRATLVDDSGVLQDTAAYIITNAEHYIEICLKRATTDISSDGSIQLWIDGVSKELLSGKDNYDYFDALVYVRMGTIYFPVGIPTGTFFLDELVVNDQDIRIGA